MKIEICFKNPDAIDDAIDEKGHISPEERETIKKICDKWFEYREYVTLIVDTEKETCEVAQLTN